MNTSKWKYAGLSNSDLLYETDAKNEYILITPNFEVWRARFVGYKLQKIYYRGMIHPLEIPGIYYNLYISGVVLVEVVNGYIKNNENRWDCDFGTTPN